MKGFLTGIILFFMVFAIGSAQTVRPKIYNPDADAKADIAQAVKQAKAEGKNVLLQIGGNWCPWCIAAASVLSRSTQSGFGDESGLRFFACKLQQRK